MITKNFKAFLSLMLENSSAGGAFLEAKDASANTKYIDSRLSNTFPYPVETTVRFANYAGIQLGSGNTLATENDYHMENQITSGLSASTPAITSGNDSNGNPYLQFVFTLTNSSASDIVVKEVGYFQKFMAATTIGGSSTATTFMLDRTLLETPLTVPANGTAVLKYTLKTIVS